MKNKSGIKPCGDRVLLKPDPIEQKLESGIIIPETVTGKHGMAQVIGTVVGHGPDCWTDYSGPFAKVGDKVMYAKYGGLTITGMDGEDYRIVNDTDITALVDGNLKTTDIQSREKFTK